MRSDVRVSKGMGGSGDEQGMVAPPDDSACGRSGSMAGGGDRAGPGAHGHRSAVVTARHCRSVSVHRSHRSSARPHGASWPGVRRAESCPGSQEAEPASKVPHRVSSRAACPSGPTHRKRGAPPPRVAKRTAIPRTMAWTDARFMEFLRSERQRYRVRPREGKARPGGEERAGPFDAAAARRLTRGGDLRGGSSSQGCYEL
jgi:hypothetical protein